MDAGAAVSRALLAEIPSQLLAYMEMAHILPNPRPVPVATVAQAVPVPIPGAGAGAGYAVVGPPPPHAYPAHAAVVGPPPPSAGYYPPPVAPDVSAMPVRTTDVSFVLPPSAQDHKGASV